MKPHNLRVAGEGQEVAESGFTPAFLL